MINYPPELRKNQPASDTADKYSLSSAASTNPDGSESTLSSDVGQPPTDSASTDNPPEAQPVPSQNADNTEVTSADESEGRDTVTSVEIIKYDDGESRLRLGAGYSKAWRVVNKSLSRNIIEVTERNYDSAQLKVQYDPDEKKAKDDSFMDEFNFIFKGIDTNDREYVLKLEEHEQKTDVIVLNEEHLPMLNDAAALHLLKTMGATIKADLAEKAKAESEANP